MSFRFFLLLHIQLCLFSQLPGEVLEKQAWEKTSPQSLEDLREIQSQLQSLLPEAEKSVVSIETGDGAGVESSFHPKAWS